MSTQDNQLRDIFAYGAQENLSEAVEAERRAMAQELEATVISQLNLILSQANAYEQTLRTSEAQMAVSVLSSLVKQALQQARDLENNLHPVILNTLGLESALEALVNQEQRRYGVRITLNLPRLKQRLPHVIELTLFRITQEVVSHAIRDKNAVNIHIQLHKTDDDLHFIIQDNGIQSDNNITFFVQRIQTLGGTFTQNISEHQRGTEIRIFIALKSPIEMTSRELEVLYRLTEGLTNREIAYHLEISPRTVKFHLDNIYSKLGVNTRTEAAIYALQQGWSLPKESGKPSP